METESVSKETVKSLMIPDKTIEEEKNPKQGIIHCDTQSSFNLKCQTLQAIICSNGRFS